MKFVFHIWKGSCKDYSLVPSDGGIANNMESCLQEREPHATYDAIEHLLAFQGYNLGLLVLVGKAERSHSTWLYRIH